MKSPEGEDMPMRGVYLEVVKNEKIVFTDAYNRAWEPSDKPFFTGIVTFEDAKDEKGDGKTRYTARALHWTAEDCEAHEKIGFHEGWARSPTSSPRWRRRCEREGAIRVRLPPPVTLGPRAEGPEQAMERSPWITGSSPVMTVVGWSPQCASLDRKRPRLN